MSESETRGAFERLGGEAGIRAWVDRFYGRIARHPLLAGLFPADLSESRDKQFAFLVQFFGGPPLYNERYGRPFLRFLHRHVRIGPAERDAWMEALLASLRETVDDEAMIGHVERKIAPIADNMVNHHPGRTDAYYFN